MAASLRSALGPSGLRARLTQRAAWIASAIALLLPHAAHAQAGPPEFAPVAASRPEAPPREGVASWYGPWFHGRLTACGEVFDQHALTAAHRTLPFGTRIAVTNLDTGSSVIVRVNDRGPYHGPRILDCSRAAAAELGFIDRGLARVRWEIVDSGAPSTTLPATRPALPRVPPAQEPARPTCMEDAS